MAEWQPIGTMPKGIDVLLYGSYLYPGNSSLTKYIYVGSIGFGGLDVETCCEAFNLSYFKLWAPMPEYPTDPDGEPDKEG